MKACTFLLLMLSAVMPAFAQTTFIKHAANPVILPKSGYSTDPAVLFDSTANLYKMWYTAYTGDGYSVYYATSRDGIHWNDYEQNPVLSPDHLGNWDSGHIRASAVVYNGQEYLLYYMGSTNAFDDQIGLAVSTDGIHWQKRQSGPIIARGDSGDWDWQRVYHPEVLFDGSTYFLGYAGYDGQTMRIGLATSADGKSWQKYSGNPVLDVGEPGAWDDYGVWPNGGSLYLNGTYYLYYSASSSASPSIGQLGLATSSDGIQWTRSTQNPILREGSFGHWDQSGLGPGTVLFDGTHYKMWYSAHTNRTSGWAIGYAASGPTGTAGTALLFDGYNDFVSVPEVGSRFDLVDFTIEAWIYRMEENSYSVIVAKGGFGEAPSLDANFALDITPQNVARVLYETPDSKNFEVIGTTLIERERWYHIAGVYSAMDSALSLYVNGQLDAPVLKTSGKPNRNSQPILIGYNGAGFSIDHHFRGVIDEVRIWKTALSASRLRTWMRHRLPSPTQFVHLGLVGYFSFDEASGQWVNNQALADHKGVLGSGAGRTPEDPEWVFSELPLVTVSPNWYLDYQEVDFGLIEVDSVATQAVRIFNLSETDTLRASNFSVDHPHFTLGNLTDPIILPPAQSAFFSINYAPTRISRDTATVRFVINDTTQVKIVVRGRSFRLQKAPVISSLKDVPFDDGGFLSLQWQGSLHELAGYAPAAVHYTLWRRSGSGGTHSTGANYSTAGWDSIAVVPVAARMFYSAIVPSLGDSTAFSAPPYTVLRVSVRLANGEVLFSEPDSAYSIDNLVPQAPAGISLSILKNGVVLDWQDNPENDLLWYNIYRGTVPNFSLASENRIGSSTVSTFTDTNVVLGQPLYFRVTAVDDAGNESLPSSPVPAVVTSVPEAQSAVPDKFTLRQNYPNPFNPATTLAFTMPRRSRIVLEILNLQGRRLLRLMDGEMPPGAHQVHWRATVPSGVYLYLLQARDPQTGEILFRQSRKMVVMK